MIEAPCGADWIARERPLSSLALAFSKASPEMGFIVSALSDTISQANKIFRLVQIILGIFGVVGLIVAGIGLINTMSITLLERTSEIGILRALGASKNDIRKLFLMESTISGFLGGIVGTGFGFVLGEA